MRLTSNRLQTNSQTDGDSRSTRLPVGLIQEKLSRDQTSTLTTIIAFKARRPCLLITRTTRINCGVANLLSVSLVSKRERERVSTSSRMECTCVVSSRQQALECDGCSRWCHRTCQRGKSCAVFMLLQILT